MLHRQVTRPLYTDDPKRCSAVAGQRLSLPQDVLPGEWSEDAASDYKALAELASPQCPAVYLRSRQRAEASLDGGGVSGWDFRLLDPDLAHNKSKYLPMLPESKQKEPKRGCAGMEKLMVVLGKYNRRTEPGVTMRYERWSQGRTTQRPWNWNWYSDNNNWTWKWDKWKGWQRKRR